MNKTAVKNFAVWARNKLIEEITYKAGLLGVTENGIAPELPASTDTLKLYDIGTKEPAKVEGIAMIQRNSLVNAINSKAETLKYKEAFEYVIEEVAYTWFNRLIAVRFMEVNGYLPSGVRVLSSEKANKHEPDMVTNPFDTDIEFTEKDRKYMATLRDDELFRFLFIKQCNALHDILPELFEKTADYSEILLTLSFTDTDSVVYHLVHDIPEDNFNVSADKNGKINGQVQIIGWLYQYYNTEPKDKVFAALKKNVKINKENIPAATQLFTPDWIVRYMVENSLGRLWADGHKDFDRSEWKYYLEEAEQEESVKSQLAEIRAEYKNITPEEIRFCDPCMGSGHILVYAFDVLMQIYLSQGYSERDAAAKIIRNNLYGLDIDKRAYQLAYFSLMMKARQYDRRFLTRKIAPNLSHFQGLESVGSAVVDGALKELAQQFKDSGAFGALFEIKVVDGLDEALDNFSGVLDMSFEQVEQMMRIYTVLSQKYHVVCTNPPYMATSNLVSKISNGIKGMFPDEKADLFACFIERCKRMTKPCGFQAMITQHAWMFLSSYEKVREKISLLDSVNLLHLGSRAFEEIGGEVVQTSSFVFRHSHIPNYKGTYCRLTEPTTQTGKEEMFLSGENRYAAQQGNFSRIPGAPVAYWVSENFIKVFENEALYNFSISPSQNITGNNDRFVRKFWELENNKIGGKDNWIFYAKGGGYRKWWGNLLDIVNWTPEARFIYQHGDGKHASQIINKDYWYKKGITWGLITSSSPSFRVMPEGATFDKGGSTIIVDEKIYNFSIGLLNSKVFYLIASTLNATLNFQVKDICTTPIILDNQKTINNFVQSNISLSRADWDSFETSWDFKKHPLLNGEKTISQAFDKWAAESEDRFNTLKSNEEELNRIFIDIYGLRDELTPEVEDKDVTVRKADLQREIKSLISYAVGCMFGRYSLDTEGLVYAGGEWDKEKYRTFIPDDDNCIPITDEEYFTNDIVTRFAEFIKAVYSEDTLEENLDFIADALGTKGNTSRQKIRSYFLNDFIKDHIRIYQKRPIYWLFDSGKQNGFKALVYMHRWNADTTGNVRVEYLHKLQRVYESEINRMQDTIDNTSDNREKALAEKRKDKLSKQLKEARDYDEKLTHLALSRIDIDLDDGVKVNYEKVQTAKDGRKLEILTPIK